MAHRAKISHMRAFVLSCWRAKALDMGLPQPSDLSGSCAHSAEFAAALLGGEVRGSLWHSWCEMPSGRIVDLNRGAADVASLLRGVVPYALWGLSLPPEEDDDDFEYIREPESPQEVYEHDDELERSSFQREHRARVREEVESWLVRWAELHPQQELPTSAPSM